VNKNDPASIRSLYALMRNEDEARAVRAPITGSLCGVFVAADCHILAIDLAPRKIPYVKIDT
jgi:hypothetical protein